MFKYILEIKFSKEFPKNYEKYYRDYKCNGEDSGVDLVLPETTTFNSEEHNFGIKLNHHINCRMLKVNAEDNTTENVGYWLLPRSSISKTPLRMSNSVGLIDMGYRGDIIGKVDCHLAPNVSEYKVKEGTRMFQIVTGDLTPISKIHVVSELEDSIRGSGGFGSTGL